MIITWRIPTWVLLVLAVAILATATRKARKAIPYVRLTEAKDRPMLSGQTIMTPTQTKMADALAKYQAIKDNYQSKIESVEAWLGAR